MRRWYAADEWERALDVAVRSGYPLWSVQRPVYSRHGLGKRQSVERTGWGEVCYYVGWKTPATSKKCLVQEVDKIHPLLQE